MRVPLNEYVPIWHGCGTLLFAPNGGKVSPPPPLVSERKFHGNGLSRIGIVRRPTVMVFVALGRVFGGESWNSEKVLTRQSVSQSS